MSLSFVLAMCCGAMPAQPRTPLDQLFTDADYPAAAREAGESGEVAVRLTVTPEGRVSGCTIARSSGVAALDAWTCRILHARARFSPARGEKGARVTSEVGYTRRWTLPAR